MKMETIPERFSKYVNLDINAHAILPISEDSYWVTLNSETHAASGALEGKLHLPATATSKLLIFEPGFPGGAATDFERIHLSGLLSAGYAIFAARHRSVLLNGPHSDYLVDCPERQQKAKAENQKYLGKEGSSMKDWFHEPLIALDALGAAFEEIVIVGHSFGGLAIMHAACELFDKKFRYHDKVKKLVHLAGVGGRLRASDDRTIERWHEFIKADWALNKIEIGEPAANVESIRAAHEKLHSAASVIPANVDVICLTAYGDTEDAVDELIPAQEALDIIVSVGHGTLIVDTTQRSEPQSGQMAHELLGLKTDVLLKLVDPKWKSSKQIVRLGEQGLL